MKNKMIMLLLSAVLLISLSACNDKSGAYISGVTEKDNTDKKVENKETPKPVEEKTEEKEIKPEEKKQEESKEDVNKKVENIKIEEEKTEVDLKEKKEQSVKLYFSDSQAMNLVEVNENITLEDGESLEMKIIEKLKAKPPKEDMFSAIPENIKVNSIKVENKVATVDISSENLNGSSTQEGFFIDSVVSSLIQLDTIDSVKFLVDGQNAESLMGHMEVTEPMTKESVTSTIVKGE